MEEVIGYGSYGVVVRPTDGSGYALKYWLPHVLRANIVGEACAVKIFRCAFLGNPRFRVRINGSKLKLRYFGVSFPSDEVQEWADRARVRLVQCAVTQSTCEPSCLKYSIFGSCDPYPIANGVLSMKLAGKPVFPMMPLRPSQVSSLVSLMCSAAQSALMQGVAIVDMKPENICAAKDGGGWVIVDVDDLPSTEDPFAHEGATYTVKGAKNGVQAMVAAVVISAAMLAGVVSKREALDSFLFSSKRLASWEDLHAICHPALQQVLHSSTDTLLHNLCHAAYESGLLSHEHACEDDAAMTEL